MIAVLEEHRTSTLRKPLNEIVTFGEALEYLPHLTSLLDLYSSDPRFRLAGF
jgi:hypothetical protein